MQNNVFAILRLPRYEAWNDLVMGWLCNPTGGHGVSDFAAFIIRSLWKCDFHEVIVKVDPQCSLGIQCRPDFVVRFETSVLILENKVAASALKAGKMQQQFDFAQQLDKPFYHVLLYPDRVNVESHCVDDDRFRRLPYSHLAKILFETAAKVADPDAQALVRQYAEYVSAVYGASAPPSVRKASSEKALARANAWPREKFMLEVEKVSPELRIAHENFLNLLDSMESVITKFNGGGERPSYNVYLENLKERLLTVYASGGLYANWGIRRAFQAEIRELASKPDNPTGSALLMIVSDGSAMDKVAVALQRTADLLE